MKKYWQLLVMGLVIVATISVHYIQVANATKLESDFSFEKISGDEKYLDPLVIEANYYNNYDYSTVLFSKDKTTKVERSFYQQVPFKFQKLVDNHKSFMRGKAYNVNNFYEDEAQLIYVKEPDQILSLGKDDKITYIIDVLNKKDNTSDEFPVQLELNKNFDWNSINNVAVVNNELKLITTNVQHNGIQEMHLVQIDLNKQQLLSDTILNSTSDDEITRKSIGFYNDYYNLAQEKYAVYTINTYDTKVEEHKYISQQHNVLNIETNELMPIDLPTGIVGNIQSGIVDNGYFVISNIEDTDMVLYRYNIAQQQWLEPVSLPMPFKTLEKTLNFAQAMNGKLYTMNEVEKGYLLQIIAIEEGKLVYSGLIPKNADTQNYHISVNSIYEKSE
ncbi:hypothetical protein DCE79_14750 [Lysinibacillus sp. 2017]|uniref:hypothetical protein n=1 Tax=unclassified Lysinibacillus TaxID=2636778 RepID=UPI000D5281FC|nr:MULTISPECIES: hypothetical protein [unclassified Lysinibacillus]AWE08550.1 hypothetical protein DCE79_14750 [Lysinibacillus sp. 2017]TGN35640.1 hypothetical protein E4L99_08570 [Lysinibacillus sp. S2017]